MKKQTAVEFLIEQWPVLETQIPQHILIQAKWQEDKAICEAFADGQKNGYEYAKKIDVLYNALDYYQKTYGGEE